MKFRILLVALWATMGVLFAIEGKVLAAGFAGLAAIFGLVAAWVESRKAGGTATPDERDEGVGTLDVDRSDH